MPFELTTHYGDGSVLETEVFDGPDEQLASRILRLIGNACGAVFVDVAYIPDPSTKLVDNSSKIVDKSSCA